MIKKIWNSPTITTWASYATKTLTMFAVLPLILKKFSSGDVALWYLFFTIIISISTIAEFGFKQTFSRLISFAFAGSEELGVVVIKESSNELDKKPSIDTLNTVVYGMRTIYLVLTVIFIIVLGIFGTWSLLKPVKEASNQSEAWAAWIVVLIVSCVTFYGKIYVNFLEGIFKVAVVKRIETITSILSILSSFIVLTVCPSLLNLIIVNQFWFLVNMARDIYLCYNIEDGLYKKVSKKKIIDRKTYMMIWGPAWKSGLGMAISSLVLNMNGVFVAQVSDASSVASYLLSLRILNQIKDISMAPFYSKLPLLAMLRIDNNIEELIKVCRRGMFISNLTYVIGFILVGLSADSLLHLINSETKFVDWKMWLIMGIAFFCQRIGGMHMQVYLSTNHVISHIADIISGLLFLIGVYIFFDYIGLYAIPGGMILGAMGFYYWYATIFSYRSLKLPYGSLEYHVLVIPIVLLLVYVPIRLYVV